MQQLSTTNTSSARIQREAFESRKDNLAFFRGALLGVMVLLGLGMIAAEIATAL